MKKKFLAGSFLCFLTLTSTTTLRALPAYPGIEGFGSETTGGSGRHLTPPHTEIIKVTSLDDSGAGTLRECAQKKTPRICIFEVGGIIALKKSIKLTSPYITIAGETAPDPGILILGAGIEVITNDVILRHLEIRPGDNPDGPNPGSRDALGIIGGPETFNVIADHLSLSWAIDENCSTGNKGVHDITIANSIISESLHNSLHPKGPHGMGMLIGDHSKRISVFNNLFAHNNARNPRIKYGASVVLNNNIIYGWGGMHVVDLTDTEHSGHPIFLFAEGNIFRAQTKEQLRKPFFSKLLPKNSKIKFGANFSYFDLTNPINVAELHNFPENSLHTAIKELEPYEEIGDVAAKYLNRFNKNVGSRPKNRNQIDRRIIKETLTGTGSIRDCITGCARQVGSWPKRKVRVRLLKVPANPLMDADGDGYLDIENWLFTYLQKVQN